MHSPLRLARGSWCKSVLANMNSSSCGQKHTAEFKLIYDVIRVWTVGVGLTLQVSLTLVYGCFRQNAAKCHPVKQTTQAAEDENMPFLTADIWENESILPEILSGVRKEKHHPPPKTSCLFSANRKWQIKNWEENINYIVNSSSSSTPLHNQLTLAQPLKSLQTKNDLWLLTDDCLKHLQHPTPEPDFKPGVHNFFHINQCPLPKEFTHWWPGWF